MKFYRDIKLLNLYKRLKLKDVGRPKFKVFRMSNNQIIWKSLQLSETLSCMSQSFCSVLVQFVEVIDLTSLKTTHVAQ